MYLLELATTKTKQAAAATASEITPTQRKELKDKKPTRQKKNK